MIIGQAKAFWVSLLLLLGWAEMKDQFLLECLISNLLSLIRGPVHKTSTQLLPQATHQVYSIARKMVHALFNETSPLTVRLAVVGMSSCYKCFSMLTLHICTYHVPEKQQMVTWPAPGVALDQRVNNAQWSESHPAPWFWFCVLSSRLQPHLPILLLPMNQRKPGPSPWKPSQLQDSQRSLKRMKLSIKFYVHFSRQKVHGFHLMFSCICGLKTAKSSIIFYYPETLVKNFNRHPQPPCFPGKHTLLRARLVLWSPPALVIRLSPWCCQALLAGLRKRLDLSTNSLDSNRRLTLFKK